jgi:hypothetical protein
MLGPDAAGAAGRVPLIDELLLAAGLAIAADDRAAVGQNLARDFVHGLGARAPGLLGVVRAVTQGRRNPVALFLGAAVADDDLVVGRLRAGILAEDLDLLFTRRPGCRPVLGQSGRGDDGQRREDKQLLHGFSPDGTAFLNAPLLF